MAPADIAEGTYRIESVAFAETPNRVLTLKGSGGGSGTPIICYPDGKTNNNKWRITKFDDGYNFQALDPQSNMFVDSIGPGQIVTGTPHQKTAFKLEATGNNIFGIYSETGGKQYAFLAPESSSDTVTLAVLDATKPHQKWHFVSLN